MDPTANDSGHGCRVPAHTFSPEAHFLTIQLGSPPMSHQPRAHRAQVLMRFVESYKNPDSKATKDFWNQIARAYRGGERGAPPAIISGWITAFFFWDTSGQPFARGESTALGLGGVRFASLDLRDLPIGYPGAPFTTRDFGGMEEFSPMSLRGRWGSASERGRLGASRRRSAATMAVKGFYWIRRSMGRCRPCLLGCCVVRCQEAQHQGWHGV
ncbi:hypothetical protein OQA88_13303 [Cercophora sp. LCS_1]